MSKVVHNKLVRDKVPEIIKKAGKMAKIHILEDDEYIIELKKKLIEESHEVYASLNKEELVKECADVLEVLETLMQINDISKEEVEKVKGKKAYTNGAFTKKIFLEYVENN